MHANIRVTRRSGTLWQFLDSYSSSDTFNADETALSFKLQPDKTNKGDICVGGKHSKERVSVLTGMEKAPLFMTGKAHKPQCFEKIRTLPTEYATNAKV